MTTETKNEILLPQEQLLEEVSNKITDTEIVLIRVKAEYEDLAVDGEPIEMIKSAAEVLAATTRLRALIDMWELVAGEPYPVDAE